MIRLVPLSSIMVYPAAFDIHCCPNALHAGAGRHGDGPFEVEGVKGGGRDAAGVGNDVKSTPNQRERSVSSILMRRDRGYGSALSLLVVGLAEAANASPFLFRIDFRSRQRQRFPLFIAKVGTTDSSACSTPRRISLARVTMV
jgi:hypothetical protein